VGTCYYLVNFERREHLDLGKVYRSALGGLLLDAVEPEGKLAGRINHRQAFVSADDLEGLPFPALGSPNEWGHVVQQWDVDYRSAVLAWLREHGPALFLSEDLFMAYTNRGISEVELFDEPLEASGWTEWEIEGGGLTMQVLP
jgi:hypothetical protein